jgi:hypothetical protein
MLSKQFIWLQNWDTTLINNLYDHYNNIGGSSSQVQHGNESPKCSSITIGESESGKLSLHFMNKFHKFRASKSELENKSEIDRYLVEDVKKPSAAFDILNWWKVNSTKFSIFAQIAKDVLSIPITTIASKSACSIGGRVLDPYWSSLALRTVKAFIHLQNWLRSKLIVSGNGNGNGYGYDLEIIDDADSYKLKSGKLFIINLIIYSAI